MTNKIGLGLLLVSAPTQFATVWRSLPCTTLQSGGAVLEPPLTDTRHQTDCSSGTTKVFVVLFMKFQWSLSEVAVLRWFDRWRQQVGVVLV